MSEARNTERPIFLHFLNRQAANATGGKRTEAEDIHTIDVLTICHACTMSVNIAQMIEYSADKPKLVKRILELNYSKILVNTSNDSNIVGFIQHRQRIYSKVANHYPMYFSDISTVEKFKIHRTNNFSMTSLLRRDVLDADPEAFLLLSDRARKSDNLTFLRNIDPIKKALFLENDIALTTENFKKIVNREDITEEGLSSLGRVLSARYFDNYASENAEVTATGIPDMVGFVEDTSLFPHYDIPVLTGILNALGWQALRNSDSQLCSNMHNIYNSEIHRSFVDLIGALVLSFHNEIKHSSNNPEGSSKNTIRLIMVHKISLAITDTPYFGRCATPTLTSFLNASSEIIRRVGASESKKSAIFKSHWESNMPLSNTKTALLVTATDIEDAALEKQLISSGFNAPTMIKVGQGYAQKYSKGLQKTIIQVRSSAGSIGDSGAELVVADAINSTKPDFVIASGICFGLKRSKHKLGDVLVATKIVDYEMVRESEHTVTERGQQNSSGTKLLSAARILARQMNEANHSIRIGPILSGLKLIDSKDKVGDLNTRFPDAIGGEMEATGVMSAASRNGGVEAIVVKAICDWAYGKKKNHQIGAAENASNFAVKLAETVLDIEIEESNKIV